MGYHLVSELYLDEWPYSAKNTQWEGGGGREVEKEEMEGGRRKEEGRKKEGRREKEGRGGQRREERGCRRKKESYNCSLSYTVSQVTMTKQLVHQGNNN